MNATAEKFQILSSVWIVLQCLFLSTRTEIIVTSSLVRVQSDFVCIFFKNYALLKAF